MSQFLRKTALVFCLCAFHPCAQAQSSSEVNPGKLAFVLPTLLDRGIAAADPATQQFIRATISPNWVSLNSSVAAELSNLPIPSPASAFSYVYDPSSGAVQRNVQSYGPVLTERAETIGKGSLFLAVMYQRFLFNRLDDVDLGGLNIAVPLSNPSAGASAPPSALLNLNGSIGLSISQVTAHFTAGLTTWLDVSYAFSIVSSSLSVRGGGTLRDTSQGLLIATLPTQLIEASATGLGDGIARVKARIFKHRGFGMALATDFRLPTGDELNYHGAGAYGIKPFLIASLKTKRISPHLNAGFQWNGQSFLASQYVDTKHDLPAQIFYSTGFDAGLSSKLTASFDLLDEVIIHGQRALTTPLQTSAGTFDVLTFQNLTRHELNASGGFKTQLRPHVVMTGNLLVSLNNAGLRARVVPLIGAAYIF